MNNIISNSTLATNVFTNVDGLVVYTTTHTTTITLPWPLWFAAFAILGLFLWLLFRPRGESR